MVSTDERLLRKLVVALSGWLQALSTKKLLHCTSVESMRVLSFKEIMRHLQSGFEAHFVGVGEEILSVFLSSFGAMWGRSNCGWSQHRIVACLCMQLQPSNRGLSGVQGSPGFKCTSVMMCTTRYNCAGWKLCANVEEDML